MSTSSKKFPGYRTKSHVDGILNGRIDRSDLADLRGCVERLGIDFIVDVFLYGAIDVADRHKEHSHASKKCSVCTRMKHVIIVGLCLVLVFNLVALFFLQRNGKMFENFQPGKADDVTSIPYGIVDVPDVLTLAECDTLVQYMQSRQLQSSLVWTGNPGDPEMVNQHRTSKQLWLDYDNEQVGHLARKLRTKAAQLTGIYDPASFEKIQLAKYDANGQYKQHFDACTSKCPDNKLCRVATLLVYLNEPDEGGETVFPTMNITLAPRKGHGALFYNVDVRDAEAPELSASLHAGSPVLKGEKYIANVWVKCA